MVGIYISITATTKEIKVMVIVRKNKIYDAFYIND